MEKKLKTHWKKTIDPNWIGTYVLPDGKAINVKLLNVRFEVAKVMGKTENSAVARFEKNKHFDKPMLLNSTNCKRLSKLTNSPYIEDWNNLDITLCQEMDRAIGGGKDWALRISPIKPKSKSIADFTEEKKQLEACKNLEELQKVFLKISVEGRAILMSIKDQMKIKLSKEVKNDN